MKLAIREYAVYEGWCFLLTFHGASDRRHLLVDFGGSAASGSADEGSLLQVARAISEACEGKLHAVAITHRHPAHLSGFAGASGKLIAACKPDLVVLPWTEDPAPPAGASDAGHERKAAVNGYRAARALLRAGARSVDAHTRELGQELHQNLTEKLTALGRDGEMTEDDASIEEAMRALRTMAGSCAYVSHGLDGGLGSVLPGVHARWIEPDLVNPLSAGSREKLGEQEYWRRRADYFGSMARMLGGRSGGLFPGAEVVALQERKAHVRWFCRRVEAVRGEELLRRATESRRLAIDGRVALELRVGKAKVLLPGSAELPGWRGGVGEGAAREGGEVVEKYEVTRGSKEEERERGRIFREIEITV